MAKALKTKTFGANIPVPQNRDDAARAVREIGDETKRQRRASHGRKPQHAFLSFKGQGFNIGYMKIAISF